MELMPARESRAWTLLLFGAASVVGIPLLIWRAQGDDTVGEVVQIFLVMMATGLAVVGAFMVWRTRANLKKALVVDAPAQRRSMIERYPSSVRRAVSAQVKASARTRPRAPSRRKPSGDVGRYRIRSTRSSRRFGS